MGAGLAVGMSNICMMQVGYPIAYFWGYKTAGVFQNEPKFLTILRPMAQLFNLMLNLAT